MTVEHSDKNGPKQAEIAEIEKLISAELPSDYREFLLKWDGEMGERRYFRSTDCLDEEWEIVALYGLRSTPNTQSISENWDVSCFYDLSEYKEELSKHIAIGDESGGSILLLQPASGYISLLAHDFESDDLSPHIGECMSIIHVATSFAQLRKILLPEKKFLDVEAFGPEWYELAELRRVKNEKIQEEYRQKELKKRREQEG